MSVFGAWAGKLSDAAAKMDAGMAITVVREQAKDFLAIERIITPKKSGALASSEAINSISGGGTHAVASVSPHRVYAQFREDGGTIHAHERMVTGRNGRLYRHTLHFDGVFAMHVTQAGAHYVEKSEAAARGALESAAASVMAEFLDF